MLVLVFAEDVPTQGAGPGQSSRHPIAEGVAEVLLTQRGAPVQGHSVHMVLHVVETCPCFQHLPSPPISVAASPAEAALKDNTMWPVHRPASAGQCTDASRLFRSIVTAGTAATHKPAAPWW